MWVLTNPKIIYTSATIISIISTDILSKIINISLNGLHFTFNYITSSNANTSIKKYQENLQILDIELKLRLIDIWLNHIDLNQIKSNSSLELIYISISESCHKLAECINKINEQIGYHQNKWFHSWRSIYLEDEIKCLERNVKILDERIKLLSLIN
jgi:hypothetical protein